MTDSIVVNALSKRYRKGRGLSSLRELLAHAAGVTPLPIIGLCVTCRSPSNRAIPWASLARMARGKTTILKLLSHVTLPTSGSVNVDGRSRHSSNWERASTLT